VNDDLVTKRTERHAVTSDYVRHMTRLGSNLYVQQNTHLSKAKFIFTVYIYTLTKMNYRLW